VEVHDREPAGVTALGEGQAAAVRQADETSIFTKCLHIGTVDAGAAPTVTAR
jgi:hypothetical protein